MKTIYIVQELAARKWWSVGSFPTREEAEDFAARFLKVRIITKVVTKIR
jgi:hypothetical protein